VSDDKLDAVFGVQQIAAWREPPTPPPDPTTRHWDRHPVMMKVKGVEREFFEIGALAAALGRKTVTIRKWEAERLIPRPRYRKKPPQVQDARKMPLPGKTLQGRRLYTRAQIEAVIAAARAARVYDPRDVANADWAEFRRLVHAAW
jgi:hypothetical protein